jgi:hypothetical protein
MAMIYPERAPSRVSATARIAVLTPWRYRQMMISTLPSWLQAFSARGGAR